MSSSTSGASQFFSTRDAAAARTAGWTSPIACETSGTILAQSTKVLVALFFDLFGEKTNWKKIDYFLLLDELFSKSPLCISRSKLTSPPPAKPTLPRSYRSIPSYRLCTVGTGCTTKSPSPSIHRTSTKAGTSLLTPRLQRVAHRLLESRISV